jgi:predicted permease
MKSADPRAQTSRMPFRRILLAGQVAVATIVLVLSGLEMRSLSLVRAADPGFRVDHLLTLAFSPTQSRGLTVPQSQQFYHQLVERVRIVPGVEFAALGHHVPLGLMNNSTDVVIDGYAMPEGQPSLSMAIGLVGDGYFETMGIPILRGRPFDAHDSGTAPKVVIVNQAMADKYWPGTDPIGKRIEVLSPKKASAQVVGIARTAKYRNIVEQPLPFMYMPLDQTDETFAYLFVATRGDSDSFVTAVRNAAREVDPEQPIYDIHSMEDIVRRQAVFEFRMLTQIAGLAAAVSLMLALLGLYATFAYSVSQRRREIGIRMAVGATTSRVFGMVILDGLKVSIPGITIGALIMLLGAAGLAQAPAKPRDPLVYAAATVLLIAVTILSCYYPARRAARIDPNECLRCE